MSLVLLVLASIGACEHAAPSAPDASAVAIDAEADAAIDAAVIDPRDDDVDGIADALEDMLIARFAPELRLAPDEHDWTRPANVDWFLPLVKLRFDHAGCPDDPANILDVGSVTNATIHAQTHYTKQSGTGLCKHSQDASDLRSSASKHLEFFLQPGADTTHGGIPPAQSHEWRAYAHVQPSAYTSSTGRAAKYDVQVWYFFPYNDNISEADHEADWEHLTVSVGEELDVISVYFAAHASGHRFDDLSRLTWVQATHVVGYVADGSHATYESAGTHAGPVVDDYCYDGGPVWQTWQNVVNLGERNKVLSGQDWLRYGGRWGKPGLVVESVTSGPPGPWFNSKWNTTNEY